MNPLMILSCLCVFAFGKRIKQIKTNTAEIPIGNSTFISMFVKKEKVTKAPIIAVHKINAVIIFDLE